VLREYGSLMVCEAVKKESGFEGVELAVVDLMSFASVKAFVKKFEAEGGRLDILILNAGVHLHDYVLSEDGYETR
jgi:NADP-dependent 3-hydroxy acid dehydrogenase YdfG